MGPLDAMRALFDGSSGSPTKNGLGGDPAAETSTSTGESPQCPTARNVCNSANMDLPSCWPACALQRRIRTVPPPPLPRKPRSHGSCGLSDTHMSPCVVSTRPSVARQCGPPGPGGRNQCVPSARGVGDRPQPRSRTKNGEWYIFGGNAGEFGKSDFTVRGLCGRINMTDG